MAPAFAERFIPRGERPEFSEGGRRAPRGRLPAARSAAVSTVIVLRLAIRSGREQSVDRRLGSVLGGAVERREAVALGALTSAPAASRTRPHRRGRRQPPEWSGRTEARSPSGRWDPRRASISARAVGRGGVAAEEGREMERREPVRADGAGEGRASRRAAPDRGSTRAAPRPRRCPGRQRRGEPLGDRSLAAVERVHRRRDP